MRRKGWKYCPGGSLRTALNADIIHTFSGCRTPVQKESGCNHMTVGVFIRYTTSSDIFQVQCPRLQCVSANYMSFGFPLIVVQRHFCYICGVLIVDTTNGGDVGLTVTDHYANSKCRLFDRRFYCTIQ